MAKSDVQISWSFLRNKLSEGQTLQRMRGGEATSCKLPAVRRGVFAPSCAGSVLHCSKVL